MKRELARRLRKDSTDEERALWKQLRTFRAAGFHFRRQAPLGKYVVDFACHHAKVIIELDGSQHGTPERMAYDEVRDDWLRSQGFTVLRFWNNDVQQNLEGVVLAITHQLETRWRAARFTPEREFERTYPGLREWMASREKQPHVDEPVDPNGETT